MTASLADIGERVSDATREVLDLVFREGRPVVIVDSPPGAGKTSLNEAVAATAAATMGMRVAVATPQAEQSYDFIRRLHADYVDVPIDLLHSTQRDVPSDVRAIANCFTDASNLPLGPRVIVANAKKLAISVPKFPVEAFDLVACDEAYQIAFKDLAPLCDIGRQMLLIGDPGQLPPLVKGDRARLEAARFKVHWASPREILRRFPGAPVVRLPASRRLVQDTVDFVQPAFYPTMDFGSLANPLDRQLRFGAAGMNAPIDRCLDALASGQSLVALVLPHKRLGPDEVDEELAETIASFAARFLERAPDWTGPMTARDVGVVDPHVASGAAVRRHLRGTGVSSDEVMVETPEIWQGLERPLIIAKHPLSGAGRLSGFGLDPGRWCVELSRHQVGCVIVGRDGIQDALLEHQHDCAERPSGAEDVAWAGWNAHLQLWRRLETEGRVVRSS